MQNKMVLLLVFFLLFAINSASWAQHEHHEPGAAPTPIVTPSISPAPPTYPKVTPGASPSPSPVISPKPMLMEEMHHNMKMSETQDSMVNPIGIPVTRQGSGTGWTPDSSPMYAILSKAGKWDLMWHGAAFLAYDSMGGPRGDSKLIGPNWLMVRGIQNSGCRGQLQLSGMFSLDPVTVSGSGYPLLLQTGETWRGRALIDHQHPHNFFSELSAKYTYAFSPATAGYIYLAPVGEPALGPVTYMHRTIALDDTLAPLGHHWQDATHISYGVATLGLQTRHLQFEASTFNGREPPENRFTIKGPTFDSVSGRISYVPSGNWAFQTSYAFIKSPESLHPQDNTYRTTASVIYNHPISNRSNLQSSFVWGRNRIKNTVDGNSRNLNSYLFDVHWKNDYSWSPFFRYEWIQKDAEELVLPPSYDPHRIFKLQQLTLGVVKEFPTRGNINFGIGGQIIYNVIPSSLKSVYGNNPLGFLIFIRIHPTRMEHQMNGH